MVIELASKAKAIKSGVINNVGGRKTLIDKRQLSASKETVKCSSSISAWLINK